MNATQVCSIGCKMLWKSTSKNIENLPYNDRILYKNRNLSAKVQPLKEFCKQAEQIIYRSIINSL